MGSSRQNAVAVIPSQKRGTPLARRARRSHPSLVVPVNVLAEKLRTEFAELASKKGSALRAINAAALDEITTACARVLESVSAVKCDGIVDPVSNLPLPPPQPDILYKNRKVFPELRKLTPEEFIDKIAPWADYKKAGLLAADFVRLLDPSLYAALNRRATYGGKTISDLMSQIGIVGRYMLENPVDEETARVARLIRAAQAIRSIGSGSQKTQFK